MGLRDYVTPVFGKLPAAVVDTGLVLKVLEPIWTTKHETAKRLRARIESVLDWARARGYREGENPVRWKGHLSELLPKSSDVHIVKHQFCCRLLCCLLVIPHCGVGPWPMS